MKIVIRPANKEDAPRIGHAEELCFSDPWSEPSVEEALLSPLSVSLIAEADGAFAGYLLGCVIPPEGELYRVAALPEYRKRGVARALLSAFSEALRSAGADRLTLEVRAKNSPALALYRTFGFSEDGVRKNYYKNPEDDAVLMSLPLR